MTLCISVLSVIMSSHSFLNLFDFLFSFSLAKDFYFLKHLGGFPGGAVVENLPASAGDTGSNPGLGRSHMPQSN